MSKKSVVCIATFADQIHPIVDQLKAESFANMEIAVGAYVGATPTGLVGLHIPHIEAGRCEGKISAGNRQISVHTEDVGDIAQGMGMFKEVRAQDICTTNEAFAPKENTSQFKS